METTLAILMVLGIFIGIPAVIGSVIGSLLILAHHRAMRVKRAKTQVGAAAETKEELAYRPAKV